MTWSALNTRVVFRHGSICISALFTLPSTPSFTISSHSERWQPYQVCYDVHRCFAAASDAKQTFTVIVKHQGKRHEVELDPTSTGETFKYQLYSLTGVEPDRQKILVKGGQLKDETDLSALGAKPGQTFMMMGTAASGSEGGASDPALTRPKEAMRFVEDMTEAEAARTEGATPAGLQNLGNTCYLNSTLQTLRFVPELQTELAQYSSSASTGPSAETYRQFGLDGLGGPAQDLTASLRDLYKQMSETQQGFPPLVFLQTLRTVFPQFAQRAKNGQGYAQQDAEEAYSQIVSTLRDKLTLKEDAGTDGNSAGTISSKASFVDRYMSGRFDTTSTCDDPAAKEAGEEPVTASEPFVKLNCHISKDTNHLSDGIVAGLSEQIDKKSAALDREATYTKTSRVARLPAYLTVHFVRFFWKREAQKKAKIMRKVTFPAELDVVDFCTETLRKRLIPVRDKVREIRKEEEEVIRARKRLKVAHQQEQDRAADGAKPELEPVEKKKIKEEEEKEKKDSKAAPAKKSDSKEPAEPETFKSDKEYEAERAATVQAAKKALYDLVDPELASDVGANRSGLYELRAVVTHQGASADSGHYTAYVKKQAPADATGTAGATGKRREEDGRWWWFNDDKVSEVGAEKIETLAGGGESFHIAAQW